MKSIFFLSLFSWSIFGFAAGDVSAQSETVSIQKTDETETEPSNTPAKPAVDEQEAAAIEFVQKHHPELVSLLQLLKSMKEADYEAAIRDIGKVRKRLESLETRDPESYAIELESWKLQSKVDLLLARAVAQGKEVDADSLRKLVKRQVETQRRRLKHERNLLADRQRLVKETLEKLETNEEERIDQQVAAFIKRVRVKIDKPTKAKSEPNPARKEEKK